MALDRSVLQQQPVVPWVEITEQPMCKNLRFRYISEARTAGSIHGERSTPERPTCPSIKIHNYSGPATVIASCMTSDEPYRPHPHHLIGNNCSNGICLVQIAYSCDIIPFSRIGIQSCTRKDVTRNLDERKTIHVDPFQNANLPLNVNAIDLTTISLGFQVFIGKGPNLIQLKPVVSQPIVDKRVSPELSVCRLSRISGSVRGGDEVFLFSSKIKKENIKVIFNSVLKNGEKWEKEGIFSATDVHKQYAIVFKTPPYHTSEITRPTDVSLYLMQPSDNVVGEPKTFTYYPENPACEKLFTERSNMKHPVRIHSWEKPYKCQSCGKLFACASSVKIHMRIHSGEKPYKCISCGKSFSRADSLRIHMRIHSGEQPCETRKQNEISERTLNIVKTRQSFKSFEVISADSVQVADEHENVREESYSEWNDASQLPSSVEEGRLYGCAVCNEIFKKEEEILKHGVRHVINNKDFDAFDVYFKQSLQTVEIA